MRIAASVSLKKIYIFSMALPVLWGLRPFIQFRNQFSHPVGHPGRVISRPQGRYLNTWQQKQNKGIRTPNIHVLSRIRTHDPSVRASEENLCLRPPGYWTGSKIYTVLHQTTQRYLTIQSMCQVTLVQSREIEKYGYRSRGPES
jgi:hypothetical protein